MGEHTNPTVARVVTARKPRAGRSVAIVPGNCNFEHMAVNQRLRALAEVSDLDIIASYPKSFPVELSNRATIRGFRLVQRISAGALRSLVFSARVALWAVAQRLRARYSVIYTFQDASACAGLILSRVATHWVMDILDDPALEAKNAVQQNLRWKAAALRLRERLIGKMARRADLVVTIGTDKEDLLPFMIRRRYGVPMDRLLPLPQAIGVARLQAVNRSVPQVPQARAIFYVGWVSALRGVDTLIDAVDILQRAGEKLELRLAGALKDSEHDLSAKIAVRPYVTYLGPLPSSVVQNEILSSEICCCPFPDREELAPVQPVKVLEYLALGRPIVGSRTHGISSLIIDGESGLLATPGSSRSFAEAFAKILDDGRLAARLAEGARARASAFDVGLVNRELQARLSAWL